MKGGLVFKWAAESASSNETASAALAKKMVDAPSLEEITAFAGHEDAKTTTWYIH